MKKLGVLYTHIIIHLHICVHENILEEAEEHLALANEFWRQNAWVQIQFIYLLSETQRNL